MGKFYETVYAELALFVRHSAWLNAVPDKEDDDKSKRPRLSRRESFGRAVLEMPPCFASYLVDYLFEIGPTTPIFSGAVALTHADIRAWMQNTGVRLRSWEARFMRRLSMEYLITAHAATKPDCPAPWLDAPYLTKYHPVNKLQASLRELAVL